MIFRHCHRGFDTISGMSETQLQFPEYLHVGTSSWSSLDWRGHFYPASIEPGEMISSYASRLSTVEIDSTWYRMPSQAMVDAWNHRTPEGFIFSAKVPRVISHDKYLEGCEDDLGQFVTIMSRLGKKLGPMVLQFPYVAKGKDPDEYARGADFLRRLKNFVCILPEGFQWAVEIRNATWIRTELLDTLRSRGISLVFIDYYTMDPLPKLALKEGVFTAPFAYIRFLGNHKQMDQAVEKARAEGRRKSDWESLLVDRTAQIKHWLPAIRDLVAREVPTYIYFNNHYAGYAPGSVELFSELWNRAD
jgi:uncharacterized protein YecE (DUF72 family)